MAILFNINGLFAIDSTGAMELGGAAGASTYVLMSNGAGNANSWYDVQSKFAEYLPLTGGTLTGNLAINGTNTLTVGGVTTLNAALTGTSATFVRDASGYALRLDSADATTDNDLRFAKGGTDYAAIQVAGPAASDFQFYVNDGTNWINTLTFARADGQATFTKLVSGITPTAAANFATKAYVDGIGGGVSKIIASTNITISPVSGLGDVTISATDTNTTYSSGNGITFTGTPATVINADINYISYSGTNNFIVYGTQNSEGTTIPTGSQIVYADPSGTRIVNRGLVSDLPFTSNTGDLTSITLGNGLTGSSLSGPIPDILMSGSYTGKFTIDSTGDVEYLALNTTATTNKRVRLQFTQNDNAGMEIGTDYSVNNSSNFYFYDRVAGSAMLFTSVASSYFPGKLAVGMTSTPNAQLHVSANGSAAHSSSTGIDVAAGAGGGNIIALDGADNHNWLPYTNGDNYYSANNHLFRSGTGNSPYYMTINTSGNVGIGMGSSFSSKRLHVLGSNHFVTFENTSTTANHYAQMLLKAGTAHGYIWTANQNSTSWGGPNSLNIYAQEAGAIAFFTTATKRMSILAGGNVNIQNKPNSGLAYDILINVGTSPDGVIGYQTQDQLASLLAVNANSNWIKTGTHIYNSNTGNVGVGTGSTAPSNRLTVNQGGGVRVTGIANGSYIELSGNLPGYAVDQYPVIKSGGTIHFANNGKYSAYLEGNDTYFGMLNSLTQTKVQLHTNGNTYFLGGSIGIGTTSPVVTAWGSTTNTRQLTIVGSNYGVLTLQGSITALTKYSIGVGGTKFYMAYDNVAGAHRMTVDSTGNVGISTTNPTQGKLEIQQTATTPALWVQTGGTTSSYTVADFRTGTNASALRILGNVETIINSLGFKANRINSGYETAANDADIWINYEGYLNSNSYYRDFRVGNGRNGQIMMCDGGTSRVAIGESASGTTARFQVLNNGGNGANGDVDYGILAKASNTGLQATLGAIHSSTGHANLNLGNNDGGLKFWHISKRLSGDAHRLEFYYNAGSFISLFKFETNGTFTAAGDIVAYSDKRLKSNIKTLDGSKVLKMRGVSFDKDGKKGSGVIAQELEKVAPELVHNELEYKGVAYGNLVGYLIEAIKELEARVKELENK